MPGSPAATFWIGLKVARAPLGRRGCSASSTRTYLQHVGSYSPKWKRETAKSVDCPVCHGVQETPLLPQSRNGPITPKFPGLQAQHLLPPFFQPVLQNRCTSKSSRATHGQQANINSEIGEHQFIRPQIRTPIQGSRRGTKTESGSAQSQALGVSEHVRRKAEESVEEVVTSGIPCGHSFSISSVFTIIILNDQTQPEAAFIQECALLPSSLPQADRSSEAPCQIEGRCLHRSSPPLPPAVAAGIVEAGRTDAAALVGRVARGVGAGGFAGDDAGLVDVYYRLGVRHMLFAYNRNNSAGGGCQPGPGFISAKVPAKAVVASASMRNGLGAEERTSSVANNACSPGPFSRAHAPPSTETTWPKPRSAITFLDTRPSLARRAMSEG